MVEDYSRIARMRERKRERRRERERESTHHFAGTRTWTHDLLITSWVFYPSGHGAMPINRVASTIDLTAPRYELETWMKVKTGSHVLKRYVVLNIKLFFLNLIPTVPSRIFLARLKYINIIFGFKFNLGSSFKFVQPPLKSLDDGNMCSVTD